MATSRLKTIRLYGKLGAQFGRVHKLAVASAAEAVHALSIVIPGFKDHLSNSKLNYAVFNGRDNLAADRLNEPSGSADIRIAPMPAGAKRSGLFNVIAGIVLIVAGVYTANPNLIYAGIGLALGGAIMMLSPPPPSPGNTDKTENKPSYSFNGPVNTIAQGNNVPLLYGRMIVGSAVISGGVYIEERV